MDLVLRGAALTLFLSATAGAGPKSVAIASGDCRDPELLNAAAAFTGAVQSQLRGDALDPAAVLEKLRPRPVAGLDETQRQIDTAQSQFYSNQLDKALELVRSALRSLERIAPSEASFKQIAQARVLEGLVLKGQGKKNEQLEAWKAVLRVKPEFALDADYHTPATISQFDALKKDMSKGKRVPLAVTSSPAGATVFLDGASVGKTPLKGAFPAGSYRLTLVQGDAQSFVYDVGLEQPQELHVDLGFEGAVRPQLPLCVVSSTADYDRALKLAARAGADRALVMRVESRNNEPGWIAGVLLEVQKGARVREGGMKVTDAKRGAGYADLVSFVLTGEPAKLSLAQARPDAAHEEQPWNPPPSEPAAAPSQGLVETVQEVAAPSSPSRFGIGRVASIAVMGVGLISAVAGLAIFLGGSGTRAALDDCLTDGSWDQVKCPPPGHTMMNIGDLNDAVASNRATSLALGLTGLGVLAAGVALFFLLPTPSDAPSVSAMVTEHGAVVGLSGRLP
jgi:hypothetical protein